MPSLELWITLAVMAAAIWLFITEKLRVDVIEAGFAASSNGDFEAVKAIADAIKDSTVCSLSRANDRDIARAADALANAKSKRIHTFIATSDIHLKHKLRMTREEVLENCVRNELCFVWTEGGPADVEIVDYH